MVQHSTAARCAGTGSINGVVRCHVNRCPHGRPNTRPFRARILILNSNSPYRRICQSYGRSRTGEAHQRSRRACERRWTANPKARGVPALLWGEREMHLTTTGNPERKVGCADGYTRSTTVYIEPTSELLELLSGFCSNRQQHYYRYKQYR